MTMREVSDILGPPDSWVDVGQDTPVHLYWMYNRTLDVLFGAEPPYSVEMIKFRQRPPAGRRYLQISWRLWVSTDAISDETKLSDVLRMPIWTPDENVVVGISPEWANIDIHTEKVRLVWHMWDDDDEMLEKEAPNLSKAAYVARRDQLSTGFHGIYSCFHPKGDRAPLDGWEDFSAQDYLALVSKFDEAP
ncbi:hypothetical protein [Rhizobium sp. CF080]|uniref:hypothetical protein n=1 Tax=Rhizobium sp. (strain CF080) TaxID=1144310 RepID=UPI0012DDB967|nr:hypothetical protein [Rhizobium sp. CF080]